ncbi:pilus assembly protein [Yersinia intermedia]|uniref:pilus assembly protein n=1 Tax=Yersinia intermedia TaxID=631 RepID=UPI000B414EA2|nr:pilus assembly protein [Yersinia intermedia]OVZ77907.1 pilus assembly protein [Yersinia intermedia]
MMDLITKGCVATLLKTRGFLKDTRGSIIEYVMVIALAGVFIGLAKPTLTELVQDTVASTKSAVAAAEGAGAAADKKA